MIVSIDPHSGVPVYRQLMDQVRLLVTSGQLRAGDELPSTRVLSAELGINPMTISKAYGFLERDGVLERRPGRPLVVSAVDEGQLRDRKLEQLQVSLAPSARLVRQLGVDWEVALRLFGELLARHGGEVAADEEGES